MHSFCPKSIFRGPSISLHQGPLDQPTMVIDEMGGNGFQGVTITMSKPATSCLSRQQYGSKMAIWFQKHVFQN